MLEQIVVVATLAEAVVETLKPIWDVEKRENIGEFYAALGIGVLVTVTGGYDVFELVGVPLNFLEALGPWPGIVLTGILVGRGSTYIHDILKRIRK